MCIKPKTGLYRHFKGGLYSVIGFARNSETDEMMVVYRAEYGDHQLWVRPYDMFFGKVDRKKYPNTAQDDRFLYIDERPLRNTDCSTDAD